LEAGREIKVWLDEREIDYGENIVLKIAEGLDADFVLLIRSPDSVDSKWVKEEWTPTPAIGKTKSPEPDIRGLALFKVLVFDLAPAGDC